MIDNHEKIRRLDVVMNEFKIMNNRNFLTQAIKTLRHIIHIADTQENAEQLILFSIALVSRMEDEEELVLALVRGIINSYATEVRKNLQEEQI